MSTADDNLEVIRAELRAEITAHPTYSSMQKVADALGDEYTSLTKKMKGTYAFDMRTVLRILELLDVTPGEFFARVDLRVSTETPRPPAE